MYSLLRWPARFVDLKGEEIVNVLHKPGDIAAALNCPNSFFQQNYNFVRLSSLEESFCKCKLSLEHFVRASAQHMQTPDDVPQL
jgi:hypothetical protein